MKSWFFGFINQYMELDMYWYLTLLAGINENIHTIL
jgi:hypothetical protein